MLTCYFENNKKVSLRHVAVDALVVRNNKLLLVKRAQNLPEGNKYALPGGFLERDETAAAGVLREMLEETGYKGKVLSLFRLNDNPGRKGEDRQNVALIFLVEPREKISQPDHEVQEVRWFDLDNLPPADRFAFDHHRNVTLYLQHRQKPLVLPIIG